MKLSEVNNILISPNKTATIPNKWFPHSRAGLFYVNREYMPVLEGVRIFATLVATNLTTEIQGSL